MTDTWLHEQQGHTTFSFWLGLLASGYMLYLAQVVASDDWKIFCTWQGLGGLAGWAFIAIQNNQFRFSNIPFKPFNYNMVLNAVILFFVNIALQYILQVSMAISATQRAGYTLAAAFTEELLFRGLIFNLLNRILGKEFAIAGSAIVFMSVHVNYSGTWAMISVLFAGLLYAYMYSRDLDITTVILAHLILNGLVSLQTLQYGEVVA